MHLKFSSAPNLMPLKPGDIAPDFTLPDQNGNSIRLTDYCGKRVVLYFYPRDNTPGCTKEACNFRDNYAAYQANDIIVLGISTDDAKSHTKFITKHNLPFPLLCDTDATVSTAYESYGLKKFMGKEYMGITRNTFVIAPDGKLEKIYLKVKPDIHAETLLTELSS
jgi:thioredoxin-dependent peroxiredoxin